MKKKLQVNFFTIAVIFIVAVVGFSTIIFYNIFQKEVMENLETCAYVLANDNNLQESVDNKELNISDMNQVRVTLIRPDGSVLADSVVDSNSLGNHKNRPEVQQAMSSGTGEAVRTSTTLAKSSFYYALKMESGNILRVSKESQSYFNFIIQILPLIGGLVILLFVLSAVLSRILAKSFVTPIERLAGNMESEQPLNTYKELRPFLATIKKQHEDIVRSSKMRQEFTANVSHELKTPLTSISGYSELIESGMATNEDVTRFAGEIHKSANRLLSLINDIIQLSQLDVSDLSGEFSPVQLDKVAADCVDMLQLNADKRQVTLHLDTSPVLVQGSPKMLEELIYNLIDNAIRYNRPEGQVYVSVKKEDGSVVLRVRDTGIGIEKKHLDSIFERFYRVDKSRSKETGGTGLGLAIVKHIVVQHKAKIEVKSEVLKGTEMIVTFKETDE